METNRPSTVEAEHPLCLDRYSINILDLNILKLVIIGLLSTLTLLSLVAVTKVLANRASVVKVERVSKQVENIIHRQIAGNESSAHLTQPMLG